MVSILAAAIVAASSLGAVSTGADADRWQSDYGKALEATRQDDRPLLVVLDVPGDPEAAVETEQFEIEGTQGELLEAYQLCHVDVSTKYGKKVAEAFHAKEFPFTAIIDKTGSVVLAKTEGQVTSDKWQETLAKYQEGQKTGKTRRTSFYRGSAEDSRTVSRSGCKSCQQRAERQGRQTEKK